MQFVWETIIHLGSTDVIKKILEMFMFLFTYGFAIVITSSKVLGGQRSCEFCFGDTMF